MSISRQSLQAGIPVMYSASSISMNISEQRLRLAQPREVSHQSWKLMKETIQLYPCRADPMQRLYLLYLNDFHEDVHSFWTNRVGNKNTEKIAEKAIEIISMVWPAKSPSSGEDRHSGRYRVKISLAEPCWQAGTCTIHVRSWSRTASPIRKVTRNLSAGVTGNFVMHLI